MDHDGVDVASSGCRSPDIEPLRIHSAARANTRRRDADHFLGRALIQLKHGAATNDTLQVHALLMMRPQHSQHRRDVQMHSSKRANRSAVRHASLTAAAVRILASPAAYAAIGDYSGLALSTGNIGRSTHADLVVGAPGETVQDETDVGAGHISTIYGRTGGLSVTGAPTVTQNSASITMLQRPATLSAVHSRRRRSFQTDVLTGQTSAST